MKTNLITLAFWLISFLLSGKGMIPNPTFVAGIDQPILCLDGNWLFNPNPETGFEKQKQAFSIAGWVNMKVPSEWYMEGYKVEKGKEAGYQYSFALPADWKGKQVVLRFGAVNSACRLFLNNQFVGEHIGAMLPFEFDITRYLKAGENILSLYVASESVADQVGRISHYAKHQVGGILRHVHLMALPAGYISDFYCDARLDESLQQGTLQVNYRLYPSSSGKELEIIVYHKGIEGIDSTEVEVGWKRIAKPGNPVELTLQHPELWHAEKPNLYRIVCNLYDKKKLVETTEQQVGFRRIEIIGNQLLVNGKTLKLYGVGLHEITPYGGRTIQDSTAIEHDIRLFKQANCNYIRTCHYPKDSYFMELCDRYGIFVEDEAPACWVGKAVDKPEQDSYILSSFQQMVKRDRHHPCVINWSIANESQWSDAFEACLRYAKEETPQIPVKFSHSEYFGIVGQVDVGARHYPGWEGLLKYQNYYRPMIFSEALHLNAYNTSENITDPGLRDLWGDYLRYFVNNMEEAPAIAGMGIWSAVDEMFYPSGNAPVGYGPWGILDGYRRQKPEYWHTKMGYSPIQVRSRVFQSSGNNTQVWIQNRYRFTNLNELTIRWEDGQSSGTYTAECLPESEATLLVPHRMTGDELKLSFTDKQGTLLSSWRIPCTLPTYRMPVFITSKAPTFKEEAGVLEVGSDTIRFRFDKQNGMLASISKGENEIARGGMKLYLVPFSKSDEVIDFIPQESSGREVGFLSPYLDNWKGTRFEYRMNGSVLEVNSWGTYADTIPVKYRYRINGEGQMRVDYIVDLKQVATSGLRQVGIGFDLPEAYSTLSWKRDGLWSDYPVDHIGRTEGHAKAFYPGTLDNYYEQRRNPSHPYAEDGNTYGSNDFRSTKHHIFQARLSDDQGKEVVFGSNGKQHFRSWVNNGSISCLVANYSNGGNEHYLSYDSNRTRISEEEFKLDGGDFAGWIQVDFHGL